MTPWGWNGYSSTWAQALIRLDNATERMAPRLEALYGKPVEPGAFVPTCRQLVQDLIDFLDLFEAEEPTPAPTTAQQEARHAPGAIANQPASSAASEAGGSMMSRAFIAFYSGDY